MKYVKHVGSICMLVIFLMTISAISAEENQTVFDGNFSDLQAKIDQTEENGILELDMNYDIKGSSDNNNNLNIANKSMTIDGKNKIIRQSHAIVNITRSSVVFKDLTMENVHVIAADSRISLINCTIRESVEDMFYVPDFKQTQVTGEHATQTTSQSIRCTSLFDVKNTAVEVLGSRVHDNVGKWAIDGNMTVSNSIFNQNSKSSISAIRNLLL
jgi:hypothetical protein